MGAQPSRHGEHQEPQPFGPGGEPLGWEGQAREGGHHRGGQQRQPQPGGIGAEATPGPRAPGQLVLHHIMDVRNGPGLLPVPRPPPGPVPLPHMRQDGEGFDGGPLAEPLAWPWSDPRRDIPQGQGVTRLTASRGPTGPSAHSRRSSAPAPGTVYGGQAASGRAWVAAARAGLIRALLANPLGPWGPASRGGVRSHVSRACSGQAESPRA